jgi:hypothetical protein
VALASVVVLDRAERIYMLYASGGLPAVRAQLAKLRAQKII